MFGYLKHAPPHDQFVLYSSFTVEDTWDREIGKSWKKKFPNKFHLMFSVVNFTLA